MQRRQLGTELRQLREAANLLQEDAARQLGKANNKISRLENGKVTVTRLELDTLLELYRASDEEARWCRDVLGGTTAKRGKAAQATVLRGPTWFRPFRDFERDASEIFQVNVELVPGVLQTPDYIKGLFTSRGRDAEGAAADETLRIREARRTVLTRDEPPKFHFVLSESALRRQIGGPAVMAAQLEYLAEVARLDNVEIQVVPFDSQSYEHLTSNFTIFRFDSDSAHDIGYIELYNDAMYPDMNKNPELVRSLNDLFGRLRAVALGPVESRSLVVELAEEFGRQAGRPTGRDGRDVHRRDRLDDE
ncbi:helix-turn-helix domain-containing protein [Haloechinothrix sp. LS1_15]|nr:helix-turn-helix domain-containing protein [Haloechinothrix sp. LS1_15]